MEIEKRIKFTDYELKLAIQEYIAKKTDIVIMPDCMKITDDMEEPISNGVIIHVNEDN